MERTKPYTGVAFTSLHVYGGAGGTDCGLTATAHIEGRAVTLAEVEALLKAAPDLQNAMQFYFDHAVYKNQNYSMEEIHAVMRAALTKSKAGE